MLLDSRKFNKSIEFIEFEIGGKNSLKKSLNKKALGKLNLINIAFDFLIFQIAF